MKLLPALLLLGLIFTGPTCPAQSVNDHDFESGTLNMWAVDSTDPTDGWSIASGISAPYGLFSARCLKITVGGENHFIQGTINGLSAGVTYRISAWIEQNLNAGTAQFGIDGELAQIPGGLVTVPNGPFAKISVDFTFTPDDLLRGPVVVYRWNNANGEVYFDTVTIEIVGATPTVTPTWTPIQPVTGVDGDWEVYR